MFSLELVDNMLSRWQVHEVRPGTNGGKAKHTIEWLNNRLNFQ